MHNFRRVQQPQESVVGGFQLSRRDYEEREKNEENSPGHFHFLDRSISRRLIVLTEKMKLLVDFMVEYGMKRGQVDDEGCPE